MLLSLEGRIRCLCPARSGGIFSHSLCPLWTLDPSLPPPAIQIFTWHVSVGGGPSTETCIHTFTMMDDLTYRCTHLVFYWFMFWNARLMSVDRQFEVFLLDHFHAKMYTKPAHIKIKYCMVWNVFLWIGRKIPSIGRWMQTHLHTHLHTCLNRSPFPCQASLVSTLWSCWLLVYWYKLAGKAGFRRAESVAGFVGGGSCF